MNYDKYILTFEMSGTILQIKKRYLRMEMEDTEAKEEAMSQKEMARYLKGITAGIGILFLMFVFWFLPDILYQVLPELMGGKFYQGICIFLWVTAVPCLVCLGLFWGVCRRIGQDRSFSDENARALKRMSHWMASDMILYVGFLATCYLAGWYRKLEIMMFAVVLILFLCVALTVVCAVLSHLVYRASRMQEEQDLTI